MSRQDDILGPHPSKHPVFGTWLDYEDKESTETSCVRTLSEKLFLMRLLWNLLQNVL